MDDAKFTRQLRASLQRDVVTYVVTAIIVLI